MSANSPTRSAKLPLSFAFREQPASALAVLRPASREEPDSGRLKPVQAIPLLLSAIAFILLSGFLIHGVYLKPYYGAGGQLWREPKDCLFPVMILGQVVAAFSLTLFIKQGFTISRGWKGAALAGLWLSLMTAGQLLMVFAVQNLPSEYYSKGITAGAIQAATLSLLCFACFESGLKRKSRRVSLTD